MLNENVIPYPNTQVSPIETQPVNPYLGSPTYPISLPDNTGGVNQVAVLAMIIVFYKAVVRS